MAHSHRMPRRKADLEVEIARLMIALRQARATAEDLREQKAALIDEHHRELVRMRYRVIGEQLGQRILERVDAEIAALAEPSPARVSSVAMPDETPAAVPVRPEMVVEAAAHSDGERMAGAVSAGAVSAEDSRALDILTAQVADLQQRLTDAQRTIETLVLRVLDLASDQVDAAAAARAGTQEAPLHSVGDADAQVRTLRFRLTGSDD